MGINVLDKHKNLYDITNPKELKTYIDALLEEVSKFHPSWPQYGYTYMDGKLVEVRRPDGKIMT